MNKLHRHRGSLVRFKCPLFWYDSRITEQKQARLWIWSVEDDVEVLNASR